MYIEMKKTGLDVLDLITLVQRRKDSNTLFPYKSFVCRCSNCLYSTKGKCALKECCMEERIRAHTCTFGEMMRYCFSGIADNVFQFRLRIAVEREAEARSCFLDSGHRKRFYEGLCLLNCLTNEPSNKSKQVHFYTNCQMELMKKAAPKDG